MLPFRIENLRVRPVFRVMVDCVDRQTNHGASGNVKSPDFSVPFTYAIHAVSEQTDLVNIIYLYLFTFLFSFLLIW